MAQKEIALMQQRSGKQRDLPNGELGQICFSTDEARVFIGLPSSQQPASLVAGRTQLNAPNRGNENVEVLTEFTPWEIINSVVNKPNTIDIPANATKTFVIQGTSRLFLEYVAYNGNTSTSILESGAVQIVAFDNESIISQQNNTNQSNGLVQIDFHDPSYSSSTKRVTISVTNSSGTAFKLEFILRGWDL